MLLSRGDGMLTTAEAARLVGGTPEMIRKWRQRGWLRVQGLDERDRPLHTMAAVREADRVVRENALKTSKIDPRKQRGRARGAFPLPQAA